MDSEAGKPLNQCCHVVAEPKLILRHTVAGLVHDRDHERMAPVLTDRPATANRTWGQVEMCGGVPLLDCAFALILVCKPVRVERSIVEALTEYLILGFT